MVHVALKLRSGILAQPAHQGLNICTEDSIVSVPASLYIFTRLMLAAKSLLENGLSDDDDDDKEDDSDVINDDDDNDDEDHDNEDDDHDHSEDLDNNDAIYKAGKQQSRQQNARMRKQDYLVETRVLSIAQNLVYSVSGGRRWTIRYVGLGSSLHQATRSKKLVEMFHSAGE